MPPPTQPTPTTLATFDGTDGEVPGSLVEDNAGNLIGTTSQGGVYGDGTVFELFVNGSGNFYNTPFTLFNFSDGNGATPSGLGIDASNNLIGTTQGGGPNGNGTVFEISGTSGIQTIQVNFNSSTGLAPFGGVLVDGSKDLFGTTDGGGTSGDGTVFEIASSNGAYGSSVTRIASFNVADGEYPQAGLVADSAGDLFGTTTQGGLYGDGTVFELKSGTQTPTALVNFAGTANGALPEAGLVADKAGDLFGTTYKGGTFGYGTVFELKYTGSGYNFITLLNFDQIDGQNPKGNLLLDNKGNLFGTTVNGGANGDGTAFELADTGGTYATTPAWVFSFTNANGAYPTAGLIADGAGNLFGTTSSGGGPLGDGTVFELTNTGFMPCFRRGTRIATPRGERAVEALAVGDLVVTASGAARPIVWLGHRRVDCRRHPNPLAVWPVRVAAGAFGPGLPGRDLFLSPDHALFLDGVLIPVRCLLDPARIVQQPADSVVYWHVELARHDVILAEGLPCESFLDTGNRSAFGNAGAAVQLHPDFSQRSWDGDACAPLVLAGPRLERARARLRAAAYSSSQVRSTMTGVRVRAARCSGVQASQSSSLASTPRVAPARSSASASATENHRKSSSSPDPASVPETAAASTVKNRASNRLGEAGGVTARHR